MLHLSSSFPSLFHSECWSRPRTLSFLPPLSLPCEQLGEDRFQVTKGTGKGAQGSVLAREIGSDTYGVSSTRGMVMGTALLRGRVLYGKEPGEGVRAVFSSSAVSLFK